MSPAQYTPCLPKLRRAPKPLGVIISGPSRLPWLSLLHTPHPADVEFASPDVHYLSSITVNSGKVYALFVKSPERVSTRPERLGDWAAGATSRPSAGRLCRAALYPSAAASSPSCQTDRLSGRAYN